MPSFSVSCRNNPVAGIMPLIPSAELAAHFRRPIARGLCPRPPSRCPSYRGALHLSRSCRRLQHLLVSGGDPGAAPRHRCGERASVQGGSSMTALAPHLSAFLREHLPRERNASPHTVATYAHAFALLVRFAAQRLKRRPSDLTIEDINPDLVLAFLDHIEGERGNVARSRNARFAAIRAFFRYLEYRAPIHRTGDAHPGAAGEAHRHGLDRSSDTRRSAGVAGGPRRPHAWWCARSGHAASNLCGGATRLRVDVTARCGLSGSFACHGAHFGQGTTRARAAAMARDPSGSASLAGGSSRRHHPRAVPQPRRRTDEPRRLRLSSGATCHGRCPEAALADEKAGDAARAST